MHDVAEARAPLSTNAYGDLIARRQARSGQTRKLKPVRDGVQTRRHRAARSQVDSPRYESGTATERARWMLEAEPGAFAGARRLRALAGWGAESQLEPVLRPSNFKLQDLRLTFSVATPNTRVRTIGLISHVSTILRHVHLQATTRSLHFDRTRGACKKHDGSADGTVSRTSRAASFISTAKLRQIYLSPVSLFSKSRRQCDDIANNCANRLASRTAMTARRGGAQETYTPVIASPRCAII